MGMTTTDQSKTEKSTARKETSESQRAKPQYMDRTLGCRFELNYLVREFMAMAINEIIKPHMTLYR